MNYLQIHILVQILLGENNSYIFELGLTSGFVNSALESYWNFSKNNRSIWDSSSVAIGSNNSSFNVSYSIRL
jgi:hypothetical protein